MTDWEELSTEIDEKIKVGTDVPKTNGRTRKVTKIVGNRIYMRTGVQTRAEKYTTKEMIKYAFTVIKSRKAFTAADLKSKFPKEYSQGSCVFSMTGGILEFLGVAKYIRGIGYIKSERDP
ncbi:MAG: hypothetical protein J7J44_03680 [Deltaproteobacteria bacterium]|nr:hypothetical protein [Deltaproteobacteria bacterium]